MKKSIIYDEVDDDGDGDDSFPDDYNPSLLPCTKFNLVSSRKRPANLNYDEVGDVEMKPMMMMRKAKTITMQMVMLANDNKLLLLTM